MVSTAATIQRLVEAHVAARPDARAVVLGAEVLSYATLNERANRLAHHLVRHGVGPEVIVGVHLDRTPELVVALLAVLKAGGAYLPLDPGYPAERTAFMLADCRAPLVITNAATSPTFAGTRIDLTSDAGAIAREPTANLARDVAPENLAYVIYTSGSTGRPKGVMIPHGRVVRLMSSTQAWFQFDEHDVWTWFHSYAFDFSVWEIWGALIHGGTVVVVPEAVRRSPADFLALLAAQRVTVLDQVPSAFRHLIAAATQTAEPVALALRYVIFGGEALELRSLIPWFARYPQPRLVNMYGITETTVHVTYRVIDPGECGSTRGSPIGVAIPDLEIHLLDATLARVPDGAEGEIYVGGAGLARGYHARPGLTAERFVPDPFSGRPGARLYKTGDLARRQPDGSLDYLGRNDAQVKIRGYRIETGEIASLLGTHPAVREAAVIAREIDDDRRLVAYVALRSPASSKALHEFLGERLPGYMIPSAFVGVDALPITPSGKIDTAALPAPDDGARATRGEYVAPETDDERMLAALWSSLLGVSPIGRGDRFFELGGHSLLAAQVASRLAADHGVAVPVRLFLTSPTLAEAAAGFAQARTRQGGGGARAARRIPQRPHADRAPISFAQESIWVHDRVLRDVMQRPRGYLECPVLQIRGPVVAALLERALNEIAARHEIWRTAFVFDDEPVQVIARSVRIPLRLYDRRSPGIPPGERRIELETIAEALASQPFVLSRAPLIRCALVTFADDEHALLLMMHHLVTDAWSEHLIAAELARLYGFLAAGEPLPPRSEVETQYGDHAAWQRSDDARDDSRAFWRRVFGSPPAPLSLPRAVGDAPTTRPIRLARPLGGELSARLAAFCRQRNLSLSAVLYAALALTLERYAEGGRFVLGVAAANRTPVTEQLPGCFTGVLPVIVDLSGRLADRPSFETIARNLMLGIADAVPHGTLALPEIARLVGHDPGAPFVQVQASTQLAASRHDAGPVSFEQDYVPVNDAKFALELVVQELADHAVMLTWVADPASFDHAGVQHVADALEAVLTAELGDPARSQSINDRSPRSNPQGDDRAGSLQPAVALPLHDADAQPPDAGAAPRTEDEQAVARMWCEALRLERVGARDDFFELGGHSLLAIRLVSKISAAFGVELSLGQFFAAPTVEQVAAEIARLRGSRGAARSIVPVSRDGILPLSSAQERLWFVERMLRPGDPRPYNVSIVIGMRGELAPDVLARSLTELIARHEIWRTNFRLAGKNLVQVIAPPFTVELPLALAIDGPLAGPARDDRVLQLARAQARPAFDLANGRLVRASLVQLAPGDHVLLLAVHHIIYDAASIDILARELCALYDAFRNGRRSPLAPLAVQYADIAHWQRQAVAPEELERQLAYWSQQLAVAPELALPADVPRAAVPDQLGAHLVVTIPRPIAAAARALAQREGVSLFMTLLAVFYAQLAKRTGQTDLVVGTAVSTRDRPELEATLGPLLNILALRTDVSGDPTLRQLVRRVRDVVGAALDHQDAPFEKVVAALNRAHGVRRAPLFQVRLGVVSVTARPPAPEGQVWSIDVPDTGSVLDDLAIQFTDDGAGLVATFEYRTDQFTRATIEAIAAELEALLGTLDAPDRPLSQLFAPRRAHELIADRARVSPDAIAVIHGDQQLSYAELERRANRVAHALRSRGVGPEARVAICTERSIDMITGILGILKAGGAYLPLDPAYPMERLRFMLDDARPVLVLAQHHLRYVLPGEVAVLEIEAIESIAAPDDTAPVITVDAHNLAYMIYTSGSTGHPKGTLLQHAGLSNLIANQIRMFGLGPGSRVLQFASPSFDASVWETFATLASGGTLVLASPSELLPGKPLAETLRRHAISFVTLPPSVLAALPVPGAADLPALATIVSAGEACSPELARRWSAGRRFVNAYGPTESTVCATYAEYTGGDRVTIGRALDGLAVHVLDPLGHPVAPGMTGELHISGVGLARGYHRRAALTAEKFIPDPFSAEPGARMYRSGDQVRLLDDGALEFVGRIDDQVKIRGFRIELGEVEAALRAHPGVRQAVAAGRGSSPADMRLIGYVIPAGPTLDPAQVLAFLERSLPGHMVPSSLVIMDAFPTTPAGKVDRSALPSPRAGASRSDDDSLAVRLAAMFAEALELADAGINDNFFELGGHSILAAHLVAQIGEVLGMDVPLHIIFDAPTPAALARALTPPDEPAPPDVSAEPPPPDAPSTPPPHPGSPTTLDDAVAPHEDLVWQADDLPLSHAQQRMWFLHQLAPDNAAYNLPYARRLRGPLDIEALRRAIEAAIHRHEALRTAFPARDGVPHQAIARPAAFVLPVADVSSVPAAEREAALARLVEADVDRPFELAARPPLRGLLVRVAAHEHVLVVTMHHIIADARSLELFWRDVTAGLTGAPPRVPPLQYADYARKQRNQLAGAALERQLAYWTAQLADAPPHTELPYRRARPRVSSAPPREIAIDLGPALSTELRELARRAGATMFMTCLAALRALLARAIGQDDVCIGAPVSTRNRAELNEVVGLFVNTLVFRTRVDRDAGFSELLRRERDTALEAYTREEVPFEMIVAALGIERGAASNPVFQVSFAHQVVTDDSSQLGLVHDEAYTPNRNAAQFDLEVETWERRESIEVRFIYKQDLFDPWVVAGLADQFVCLLRGVVRDPAGALARVPIIDDAERQRLVTQWNAPEDEARDTTLAALFEAQVDRTPDATALVLGRARVTYRQLDERANRIATCVRALAIGPEAVVGVMLERSFHLVAAILGVTKAGAAWLPLDPDAPPARLAAIVEASRPRALVSSAELAHALRGLPMRELPLPELPLIDVAGTAVAAAPGTRGAPAALSGDSLAYVIFTSGSTGQPKGVMISHRAITNELACSNQALGHIGAGDAFLQLAPFTFDQAVHEVLWPLANGAAVVLVEDGDQRDPPRLIERIQAARVTILDAVPALLRALVAEPGFRACTSLRVVVSGGEALPIDLVHAVFAACPGVALWNGYGPTETAITVCYWRGSPDATVALLGTPWRNVQFYVLDAHLQPVPLGAGGELYIAGRQLARGYAGRPDLTAERFVPDPFAREPGRRMYRTGDRVRRHPDGTLEFLGRADEQIKLRGFRIEPGEIEAALRAHPAVAACAVVLAPSVHGGDLQLAAYVVAREPSELDVAQLRSHLTERLPEYMVPTAYVVLDALPLTASGKLDRRALPAPGDAAIDRAPRIAPRTGEETAIAAIWCEVLDVDAVGIHDDFFALGGHSLLATQVISRVRAELDVPLTLQHLFDAPTIAELAAEVVRLSVGMTGGPAAVAEISSGAPRGGDLELSHAQQRLWLVDRMFPGSSAYHMPTGKRIHGALDAEALRRAFEDVVHRHEILRTTFPAPGGLPRQRIAPPARWELPLDDLSALPEPVRHDQLHRISRDDAACPFDLETGPVLRTRLVRLAGDDHVVLVTMHHIVSDGWSLDVWWREVAARYDGHRRGRPVVLAPLALQYADVAAQQRAALTSDVLAGHLAFWKQQLAGAPAETALPRKAARRSHTTGVADEVVVELGAAATRAVRELGQREGATLFMTLLAAFRAVIARTTGQDDLVIGTPIANRDRQELEALIGLFVNTLVLRGEVDRKATFAELVRRERAITLAAYAHQDAPFEMIVDELGVERQPGRSPVFQIWFVQETALAEPPQLDRDVRDQPFHRGLGTSKFDLSVYVTERRGGVELALTFDTELFDRRVVDGIARRFVRALELGAEEPDRSFAELALGEPATGSDPGIALPATAYPPVLQVIEELVETDPGAPALRHGDLALTRGELWAASASVANALTAAGIAAGHRVALSGPPSPGLIAGFLGILRAGACFVPLSSRLAGEHADRLLELADARVILQISGQVSSGVSGGPPRTHARVPAAQVDAATGAVTMPGALAIPSRPADPAVRYLYFTSGTTGAHKGVIGNLVALAQFSAWQRAMFGGAAGPVSAQLTELGFDVFLRDVMFALTAGKILALPPRDVADLEAGELLRWMARARVTAIHTVPSLARSWLQGCPDDVALPELRCVFIVGEPLDAALVERWRARFGTDTEFINLYGTTETGPAKCWYRVPHPPDPGIQPIGWPLPDTQILVMRDERHLAAAGEVGEIVIRTPFSTLGYLDAARDTTSFTPNPFRADPADILYRTGDLGRHRLDGAVEILGRADDQVKIRGQRVDPPGIAAALRAHPAVMDAAVIAPRLGTDDVRLVAYVVCTQPPPKVAELRAALRRIVPPYMIPASFVFLGALPRKPNGKLDRSALPAPDWEAGDADVFAAPRNPEEEAIAAIWCEVLGVERVGVRDDFFALGGHSLLAVLVTSRVRAVLGVDLGLQRFFEAPTVEGIAANVIRLRAGSGRAEVPDIEPVSRGGDLPLSFAQQRMWFLHRLAPTSPAYHVPLQRRVRGTLAPEALRRCFEDIVRRHEALRAVFPAQAGVPLQRIGAPGRWELPIDDLSRLAGAERDAAVEQLARSEAEQPFDLATGPILRTRLVRLADDDHLILVTLHHIVSDGWSMGVFWAEVSELYRAHTTGTPARLAPLAIQYPDVAAWQRRWLSGGALEQQLAYWTTKLAGAPAETALPLARPRPKLASSRGRLVAIELDEDVVAAIRALGRKTSATQFVTLIAAFRAVVARTTGQTDLCIGTPIANRSRRETEPLIGLLLNTLVLRTQVPPELTFAELVRRERATALEAYAHQDAPFEMIVDALEIERSLERTPLFQISFVHQNMPQPALPIGELVDEPYATSVQTTRFDLSVISFERARRVTFEFLYNEALFDRWQIEQLAHQFVHFLREALADPERPIARIPLIAGDERQRLLVAWNRTPGAVPDTTIPALFEAQVDRSPEATALVLGDARLGYRELDERANRIAWALRERGIGPEAIVGIALERSFDLVAAMLGVAKAGGAWVPLDPQLPAARLDYMAGVARPRVIIASAATAGKLPPGPATVFDLGDPSLARLPPTRPDHGVAADHLAYVLFTSGSTGRPKGVMIPQRGIVNELVSAQTIRAQLGAGDAFLQLAPYTFDLSVHEILWPLVTGARVVLLPEGDHRDPRRIIEAIRAREVTILHPVPALLRALLADPELERCTSLRAVCSGGEAMPLDVARAFTARFPGVALINSYGPTETSVTVSQWRCPPDASAVAIGTPWLETQLYVLDAQLEPVPLGVAGELYIGGRQVGRGYAGQPALTAERFVPDPFRAVPGSRLYRTGDRVRRWPDGNLEVLGRVDRQVKLRGFRIELGEIEAVLREQRDVREVAVVLDGAGHEARLVAYVVFAGAWSAESLRAQLASRLPDYMVPKLFVPLSAMPLTSSGKVDHAALPAPDDAASGRRAYDPPRTPLEEILAGIWSELLGIEQIGRHDDFFELGGHSLLAARLAWQAKVSIATIFAAPTIAELAAALEAINAIEASGGARANVAPPMVRIERGDRDPLVPSYAQQRMWFLHQLAPASPAYHMALGRQLRGPLDVPALRLACDELIARHEVLRTVFPAPAGIPHQEVRAPGPCELAVRDVSALPVGERAAALEQISRDDRERPFDLARGPLVRMVLVRTAPDEHVLYITLHHIVSDGASIEVLWHDLEELYSARVQGRPAALAPLAIHYADYAAWQRAWFTGDVLEGQLAYWRQRLGGAPEDTALPLKAPRPALQTHRGASLGIRLGRTMAEQLHAASRRHGCTLFITLLAGFRTLLYRYTGQGDICIGAPSANRNLRETERLIGLFVNTLVLRTPVSGEATFAELLGAERATALEAFAHGEAPFEMVVEALGIARSLSRNPVFQVMFQTQFLDDGPPAIGFAGLVEATIERGLVSTHVDLDVSALVFDDDLELLFVYSIDLFDPATIADLARHFRAVLGAMVADPDVRISDAAILTPAERLALVHGWNRSARDVPARAFPALFDEQVERTPDAIAVASPAGALTYRELAARTRQLAHRLVRLGLRPEERVGICLDRGPELLVAMLAVMRAGGAYVPLDSELPAERLAYMAGDAGVRILVTQPALRDRISVELSAIVEVGEIGDVGALADEPGDSPGVALSPQQLAYVLYTSGSTGRPKGVQIQHGSLVNFLVAMRDAPGLTERDTLLAVTTASFDISGLELYLPLLCGARVVIASREDARDAARLLALLDASGATVMQATPATWRMLVEAGWRPRPDFVALCGGEALPPDLAAALVPRVVALWNLYGPTETTIWSARARVTAGPPDAPAAQIWLGEPIANTRLYVLDPASLEVQPLEVAGELFIAGDGLARGYGGQPGLTAERFLPDPFAVSPGARMYRTGDLVRRRASGDLEFLGRIDHQIKIRGFRIEPGEIEAALADHPGVAEVVVVARHDDGEPRLVAYVVAYGAAPATDALLATARARLPDYMVPSAIVVLDSLPLSPAGKLDRRALPAPDRTAFGAAGSAAPRTPIEEILAGIWSELLGIERVGIHDNFFDLGGHSLLAMRVLWAANRALGTTIPLEKLFSAPTIAELAAELAAAITAGAPAALAPPLLPVPRGGELPLSYAQQRMWFLHQLNPTSAAYHIATGRRLRGPLDVEALRRAIEATVRRHEALRTVFPASAGVPRQDIREAGPWELPVDDLSHVPAAQRADELERRSRDEAGAPFDLAAELPLRTRLVRLAPDHHVLFVTLHHIVADGWSLDPLWADIQRHYVAGVCDPAPSAIQYADYAAWQRGWLAGDVLAQQLAYWRQRLVGAPQELALPFTRPRPPRRTFGGGSVGLALDRDLADGLRAIARRHNATLVMALLAGLRALLHRYTGQRDICIGMPVANRTTREVEPLVGLFVNTIVLRCETGADASFAELVARERAGALEAYAHQDTPFEMVIDAASVERSLDRNPLFQVLFQILYDTGEPPVATWGDLAVELVERTRGATHLDLDIAGVVRADGIELSFGYSTDLFDETTIAAFARHFRALLGAAVATPDARISELPILAPDERLALVHSWNRSQREIPHLTVPQLFDAQVARTPDAIAVTSHAGALTYRELAARTNQLARQLLRLGVLPEERVGICLDRGPELVIAMLAVIRAGGAYVPLDGALPVDRLAYMASDAGIRILVTQPALRDRITVELSGVIDVTAPTNEPGDPVSVALAPQQLVHVLYTSGSTGRPKGVHIQHGALVNLLVSMQDAPGLTERDTLLAITTTSFDISGVELYLPLLCGSRLVIASRDDARDAARLAALLEASGATFLQATPATWRMLVDTGWRPDPGFVALTGGEALAPDLAAALVSRVAALWNGYGPTEATIYATRQRIAAGQPIRLGEPVANTQVYVLDPDSLEVQPFEVAGELCIAGAGLARGYGGQPAMTAERFLPDPFSATPGARMYRTGDLVRRRADGSLEFLGRIDHQVKIRGFRIELGEIEAVLAEHPGVAQVVVVARADAGEPRLVAYVVASSAAPTEALMGALLTAARARLPDYMVPAAVVVLDHLPRNPAGKLDRRALPAPDRAAFAAAGYTAPRTPVEEILAGIWRELVGVERVGIHDNFFDLGGHSLLAIRLVWQINRTFGVSISLAQLFLAPTIEQLAALPQLRSHSSAPAPSVALEPTQLTSCLATSQQAVHYNVYLDDPTNPFNHMGIGLALDGKLVPAALERAIGELIRRHGALRTTYRLVDGRLHQFATPANAVPPFALERADISTLPPADQKARLETFLLELRTRPFDLAAGPVLRGGLAILGPERHVLALVPNHLSSDGAGVIPLLDELMQLYRHVTEPDHPAPDDPVLQYIDYADYLHRHAASPAGIAQTAYWQRQLAGAPPTEVPAELDRAALDRRRDESPYAVACCDLVTVRSSIPGPVSAALGELARQVGGTKMMVLLAGYAATLHRFTRQTDICIQTAFSLRHHGALERVIGLVLNSVIVRLDLSGQPSFSAMAARATAAALAAFENGLVPVTSWAPHGIRRVNFNYVPLVADPTRDTDEVAPGLSASQFPVPVHGVKTPFDLHVWLVEREDIIHLRMAGNAELFRRERCEQVLQHYVDLLAEVSRDPSLIL